jgi:Ni/Co efflux regulator RcnB
MMKQFLSAIVLSSALIVPAALALDDHDRDDRERVRVHRYYDRKHHDYHEWNERENRAYRHYIEEQHRQYREWNAVPRRDQAAYWQWRHEHMDWDGR